MRKSNVSQVNANKKASHTFIPGESGNVKTTYKLSGNLFIRHRRLKTSPSKLGSRSNIAAFSSSSGRRMRAFLRECVPEYRVMVTLTYPASFPLDGRVTKEHLRRFVQELKRDAERKYSGIDLKKWSCFWFMEFQRRGAVHFHLFVTCSYPKQWIAETWYRIVGSDDIRHKHAGTRIEKLRAGRKGTISYASKYAAKQAQKEIPDFLKNTGRFWGVSGCKWRVSAATTLSLDLARSVGSITNSLLHLKQQLDEGIARNVVKCLADTTKGSGDIAVYAINDDDLLKRIHDKIMFIEMKKLIYSPKAAFFDHDAQYIEGDEYDILEDWTPGDGTQVLQ